MHIEEITKGLDNLVVKAFAISYDQHIQLDGDSNLQILERQERALEKDRLTLEVEKKTIEQS